MEGPRDRQEGLGHPVSPGDLHSTCHTQGAGLSGERGKGRRETPSPQLVGPEPQGTRRGLPFCPGAPGTPCASGGVNVPSLTSAFSVSSTFCPLMSRWITLWAWRWARPWGRRGGEPRCRRTRTGAEERGGHRHGQGWAEGAAPSSQEPKCRPGFRERPQSGGPRESPAATGPSAKGQTPCPPPPTLATTAWKRHPCVPHPCREGHRRAGPHPEDLPADVGDAVLFQGVPLRVLHQVGHGAGATELHHQLRPQEPRGRGEGSISQARHPSPAGLLGGGPGPGPVCAQSRVGDPSQRPRGSPRLGEEKATWGKDRPGGTEGDWLGPE